jgi:hypothetical protein
VTPGSVLYAQRADTPVSFGPLSEFQPLFVLSDPGSCLRVSSTRSQTWAVDIRINFWINMEFTLLF